jgi:hypothetical protein
LWAMRHPAPSPRSPAEGRGRIDFRSSRSAIRIATGGIILPAAARRPVSPSAEAYQLLAPIYESFTAGCDTADLREAKALLQEGSEGLDMTTAF